jgi:hypothetical protein
MPEDKDKAVQPAGRIRPSLIALRVRASMAEVFAQAPERRAARAPGGLDDPTRVALENLSASLMEGQARDDGARPAEVRGRKHLRLTEPIPAEGEASAAEERARQ